MQTMFCYLLSSLKIQNCGRLCNFCGRHPWSCWYLVPTEQGGKLISCILRRWNFNKVCNKCLLENAQGFSKISTKKNYSSLISQSVKICSLSWKKKGSEINSPNHIAAKTRLKRCKAVQIVENDRWIWAPS